MPGGEEISWFGTDQHIAMLAERRRRPDDFIAGSQIRRLNEVLARLLIIAEHVVDQSKIVMRFRQSRLRLDGRFVLRLGSLPLARIE